MAPGVEAAPAVAPAPGVVRGRVTNGTAGGEVPQSLEVTLHGFDGQVEAVTQSATVDADGAFAFDQVENTPGRLFVVTASHHGVIYGSEALHLQEGGGSPELSVVIYETTQEPSELRVNRLHLLFEFPAAGTTEVVELWLMSNLGDRTLATEGGQGVLEMPLPEGASRPIFEEGPLGGRYQEAPGGFVDTLPVRPGEDAGQLTFSYTLPYERGLDYARPIPFPVSAVVVLIPESGPVVSGEGVVDLGSRVVGGTALHQYEVGPLAAGARLDLTLTGRPPSRTGEAGSGLTPGLAIGGLALLLSLAAAGWMWFRRPGRPAEMPPAEVPPESPEDVIRSIARLDEEHEAGHISDADHARRRPALVRRAADLLRDRSD
jgi:hypothetical protein